MNLSITCVVIEDERAPREAILDLLKKFPELTIVGTAKGVNSGFQLIAKEQPDAAFIDVKIMEGDAFMILNRLKKSGHKVPISVIITGHSEYAIQAFDYHDDIISYLEKPISALSQSKFREVIDVIIKKINTDKNMHNNSFPKDYFFIQKNGRWVKIKYEEIFYVETGELGSGCIRIVLENKKISLPITLNSFLSRYPSQIFLRISRQKVINTNKIESVHGGDSTASIFRDGVKEEIAIGGAYFHELIARIAQ